MMRIGTLCFAFVATVSPLAAGAQELSNDELLEVFQTQRNAFKEATESGLGKTRGLTLVTVDNLAAPQDPATSVTGSLAAPGQDSNAISTGGGDGATVIGAAPQAPSNADTPVVPVVYGRLAEETQVNVRVVFDFDSAALAPSQKPKLAQLCSVMSGSDINLFRIVGHTDASGSDEYNERLSLLRAQEVKRYFVDECGMDAARLEAIGLGERFLYDETDPAAGENRRVEFQALS